MSNYSFHKPTWVNTQVFDEYDQNRFEIVYRNQKNRHGEISDRLYYEDSTFVSNRNEKWKKYDDRKRSAGSFTNLHDSLNVNNRNDEGILQVF